MANKTLTAMFADRAAAEAAGRKLMTEFHLDASMIRLSPEQGGSDTGYDKSRPYEERGYFGSLRDLRVPDEDRYAYAEGMRRGSALMTVQVADTDMSRVADALEQSGAIDLDAQETSWKREGWTGYDAQAHAGMRGTVGTQTAAGGNDAIQVVEERLVIGKRMVEGGRVRVRAYVVERPVEEQVVLRDETVHVERHHTDRPATAADLDAFRDKTIEMTETDEEAVVSKEVRVVEEIGIRKEASDRVETVRDTVRHTQVDVEGDNATGASAASVAGGTGSMTGSTGSNPPGTVASRAVDKTLGTNVSGANPGGNAPDGTPGNPPGTMASRAVDKTLGTNISGANPDRKS